MDIETLALLKRATEYFHQRRQLAYLVGGSLRDLLLGEPCHDWDIVTGGNAHALARRLADTLGGHYARLHDKASRVIVKRDGDITTFDISPLQRASIEDDLRLRDFTINALAAPLREVMRSFVIDSLHEANVGSIKFDDGGLLKGSVIDPSHGLRDIQARRLRVVDDNVFRSDPLRMLRAVRFVARYSLALDRHTQALILRDAALLPSVAAERIHDELYAILEPEGATAQLRLLDSLGLLTMLIPELMPARDMRQPSPHYWDVLEHSLETVGALECIARLVTTSVPADDIAETRSLAGVPVDDMNEIRQLLVEAEQQGIFSIAALTAPRMKMAALLHDIGKPATFAIGEDGGIHFYNHPQVGAPMAQQIMRRLSASMQDRRLVQLVAAHHMRPGQLGQDGAVTPRAIRRYFVDLGSTGMLVALFSLADHLATFGPQPLTAAWERHLSVARLLLTSYVRDRERILPPRLLSAEELIRRLKLTPGPLVGSLLDEIAEAQAEGRIHSREEALWLAEERLSQRSP
jgi:putative nucleotidyltransferase with HDIG domain